MADPRPMGTFCWCELGTSDPGAAKEFYGSLFGWTWADEEVPGMGTYTRLQHAGGELGGLYELAGPFAGIPPHWMFHVSVEDVDATFERVPALGGTVRMPPTDIPDVGRMAVIQDATGATLSLFQPGGHQGTTIDPMATGSFCWVELQTNDAARAREFYAELFGWESKTDAGAMPYTEWSLPGGTPFGGMIQMDDRWHGAPPAWMGYVHVEDCDATLAAAKELGATPFVPPTDIENVGRFAVVADPQGAVFAFLKLAIPTDC